MLIYVLFSRILMARFKSRPAAAVGTDSNSGTPLTKQDKYREYGKKYRTAMTNDQQEHTIYL